MAEDSNDTQSKINEEDRAVEQRRQGSTAERGQDSPGGSSGMPGGYEGNNPGAQGGSMSGTTGSQVTGTPSAQGAGSVGSIGGEIADTDYSGETSEQGSSSGSRGEPLGAGHQQSADGGSVTFAGSSSTGPGAGQAGTDRSSGFIGSGSEDEEDPQQAGFAEQGRGAPSGEGSNFEGSGERTANRDSDIEGSSENG